MLKPARPQSIIDLCSISSHGSVIYILYIIKNCRLLPPNVDFESKIPHDVRTISKKLHLDSFLVSYVCCIKCFSVHPIEEAPFQCGYKLTENSPMCGINLFGQHKSQSLALIPLNSSYPPPCQPKPKFHPENPQCCFVTQDLEKWLQWFLCLPEVEGAIQQCDSIPLTNKKDPLFLFW
ncbi:hypothetical protein VP01_3517g3 [Puccinia sorghi]|uniref:Uncharacterized protein n=1 Tax=Puccinia sorghi TaxID=27349 RepID=A0A0L6UVM1_9BASI|nr:hypothetical protein VP01_3517g3 [Puccinia sorghi]